MNAEQQRALDLLEKLISAKPEKRVLRSLELLGSPIVSPPHNQRPEEWGGWCDGWALCIQPTLATALDILLTPKVWKESVLDEHEQQIPKLLADGLPKLEKGWPVYRTIQRQTLRWTQGSTFDFKQGYTIHDVPEARSMSWGQALHYLKYTVQIAKASPAVPATKDTPRDPGAVIFRVYSPNQERTKVELVDERTTTQDGFVRFLITGEL